MNKFYCNFLILLFAVFGAGARAQTNQGTIVFRDGDLLYGKLLAIDAGSSVRWQHPDASQPIDFKPDAVAEIDFPASTNAAVSTNEDCRLLLANGDTLEGSLDSCNHENITLQTWYAGRLTLPRTSLQSLVFVPHSPTIFNGITGLDGWTEGGTAAAFLGESGKWSYRNGAFYADKAASIARDLKLPGVAEIQFDLAWKGALNLAIAIYTDSLQPILLSAKDASPDFGGFYSLRFYNSAFIDLWPIKKNDHRREPGLGQLFLPSLSNKDHMHVDLRISKPRHKIALFIDDRPVKEWDDPEGFIGEGTCMRFVQNTPGVTKLSNLRITPWDGVFTETPDEAPDTTHDVLWPENAPKVTGIIDSIANGKLTARTTNGPVQMPLAEVKAIDFAHAPSAPAPAQAGEVRATFTLGGSLNFILESWRPDEILVHSAAFGKARINPDAFSRLQFLTPEKKSAGPDL